MATLSAARLAARVRRLADDPLESESLVGEELDERGLETGDEDEEDEEVGER